MADVEAEQVRTQLDRILASQELQGSDRLCRFLRFTVAARLRGEQDQIKEYLIGREVFDRNGDYDPRIDPIVRVEARRLRRKLEEYYAGPGLADPVRIEFPKGSYVPVFGTASQAVVVVQSAEPGPVSTAPPVVNRRRWLAPVLACAALVAATLAYYWRTWSSPAAGESLAVIPARWVWRNEDFSNALNDEDIAERVAGELATRHGANVISWPSLQKYRSGSAGVKQIATELGVERILIVSVRVEAGGQRATAFLIDAKTDRKLGVWDRSGLDLRSPEARSKAAREMASAISPRPAQK